MKDYMNRMEKVEMEIMYATEEYFDWIVENHFLSDVEHKRRIIKDKIERKEIIVLEGQAGILMWGFLGDVIPIMTYLMVEDGFQRKGLGTLLVKRWEELMKIEGHLLVMTSTEVVNTAQQFYRKLGYKDIGGYLNPPEYKVYELILVKEIGA